MMIEFIDIHSHKLEKSETNFSIYNISLPDKEIPEKIFASVGWHPWHIETYNLLQIEEMLKATSSNGNILALGECGLDRSVKIDFVKQVAVFKIHVKMAIKDDKILIIHCVRAYSDLLQILKNEKYSGKLVLHNFNGNKDQINRFLKFDTYFSLGKQMLNPASKMIESLKFIPSERLFIETDNSELSIAQMYDLASKLSHISIEDLKLNVKQNLGILLGMNLIE